MEDLKEQLVFAIDYYNTFDKDPNLFREIVNCIESNGHKAYIIIHDNLANNDTIKDAAITVGRTDNLFLIHDGWKRNVLNAFGIKPNIWIDDSPEGISRQEIVEG